MRIINRFLWSAVLCMPCIMFCMGAHAAQDLRQDCLSIGRFFNAACPLNNDAIDIYDSYINSFATTYAVSSAPSASACTGMGAETCFEYVGANVDWVGSKYFKVKSCLSCKDGYTLTPVYVMPVSSNVLDCTFATEVCIKDENCASCTNCDTTPSAWTSVSATIKRRTVKTCNCGTRESGYEYRCIAGYYGSPTNSLSGCTPCPEPGTSDAGTGSAALSCYVSDGTPYSDETGSGAYRVTSGGNKCRYGTGKLDPLEPLG